MGHLVAGRIVPAEVRRDVDLVPVEPELVEVLRPLRPLGRELSAAIPCLLVDNIEWAQGCRERFGLIHIDYNMLARTPKDSAAWLSGAILNNGANIRETSHGR